MLRPATTISLCLLAQPVNRVDSKASELCHTREEDPDNGRRIRRSNAILWVTEPLYKLGWLAEPSNHPVVAAKWVADVRDRP